MEINSNYTNQINPEILCHPEPSTDLLDKAKKGLIDFMELVVGHVDPNQVQFKDYEFVIWPDTSMGCPAEGGSYAQVLTGGYQMRFAYQEKIYTIHINLDGSIIASPDFLPPAINLEPRSQAPSIFALCTTMAKPKLSHALHTVNEVKRHSDLDKDEYFFEVTLDNQQTFKVPASLEELQNNKILVGMSFKLINEAFVPNKPGFSSFNYASSDEAIQMAGDFASVQSHWIPSESHPKIELTEKITRRSGMSNFNFIIRFSDGSGWNIGYDMFNKGIFNKGDQFFKVAPTILVNKKTGRVIDINNMSQDKFVRVTWK